MPLFGHTSMLAADRDARTLRRRVFFDAEHRRDRVRVVASETKLQRVLRWLDPQFREVLYDTTFLFNYQSPSVERISSWGSLTNAAYRSAGNFC